MNARRDRPESLGAWSAQWLRRLLGWPGMGLIPIALALLISFSGSAESNFSVSAHTEVVSVEPSCALTLRWSLAPGSLKRSSANPLAAPQACGDGRHGIDLTLRAGSRAVVEHLANGQWQVSVMRSDTYAACASDSVQGGRPAFEARVAEQDCGRDAGILTYRSVKPAQDQDPQPQAFAYLLEGRVVVGAPVLDSGGWDGPATTALREARVQARIKAAVTQQSISVLDETIEAGSIIDTSPRAGPDAPSARGFVRPHQDGGLSVLVHVTGRHVGVTPHAGERRDVSVSRWAQWIASPFLQALLLAFGVVVWSAQAIGTADTLRDTAQKLAEDAVKDRRRAAWTRLRRKQP